MRILLALIYIAVGMWGFFQLGGEQLHPSFGFIWCFFLVLTSVIVCNEGFLRLLKRQSDEEYIKELLDNKLAIKEHYKAIKVITFEDLGTGCLCHLINVGKNEVLCLYGQYLYDYCEIDDDPEINQSRQFPTSDFSIVRKLKNSDILNLEIGSEIIDENRIQNIDIEALYEFGVKLDDGTLMKNIVFEELLKLAE
ncbi:MAG: hypothetical protein GY787_28925 [Alteromonadales bacterium]|nr:hypothetical protein [Alteromonadales bacterium]